jgi:uncharacterized phage infection (PIP) family protein YhgE
LSLPASGALYPSESLPAVWQWFYAVMPMRYMVDRMRSVLFLNNEMENGLGTAIIVLSSYAVGALIIAGTVAWLTNLNTANKTEKLKATNPFRFNHKETKVTGRPVIFCISQTLLTFV